MNGPNALTRVNNGLTMLQCLLDTPHFVAVESASKQLVLHWHPHLPLPFQAGEDPKGVW